MKKKLNPAIIELAAKYDRLANEKALANVIDANGMGHDDDNGQFDGSGTAGSSGGSGGGESQSSRLDRMLGEARAGVAQAKAKATAAKKSRISASRKFHKELEAHLKKLRERRLALKEFNDRMAARLSNEENFDESKHPRSDDGKFSSGGGGGGEKSAGETQSGGGTSYREKQIAARQADVDSAQKAFDEAKAALIAGQKRGWSKEEDDKAFKVYDRAERKLAFAKRELRSAIGAPPISRAEQMRRDTKDVFHGNASQATRARLIAELAARFNSARKAK